MNEQAENNFEGLLDYFNTDPIMQSILNEGKNSPYLSEISSEIAEQIANSYRETYDDSQNLQNLKTKEDYQNQLLKLNNQIDDALLTVNDVLSAASIAGKLELSTGASIFKDRLAIFFSVKNVSDKEKLLYKLKLDFQKNYPDVNIDDGVKITYYKNLIGDIQPILSPNVQIRNLDPKKYDEIRLLSIELEYAKNATLMSLASMAFTANTTAIGAGIGSFIPGVGTAAGAGVGLAIGEIFGFGSSMYVKGQKTIAKAKYLDNIHPNEQNFALTYAEQFFDKEYGYFKNLFKGNANSSSSKNIIEQPVNILLDNFSENINARTIDITENTVIYGAANTAANTGLVFSGGAGNDTLVNIEDNYSIEADAGDDEISNVGDNVTINADTGNDNIANLGDNVKINGGAGNNNVDNAGTKVTINVADGDNYVGNSGDSVTVNAGNGNNYIDNVGNFAGILLGNGANDVENFGSNVTVSTGSGVDFIVNYGINTTINAGSGNNVIYNSYGFNVLINTDKDDDYISVKEDSDRVTINAGSGSDVVINNGTKSLINLGAGNDYVYNDSLGSGATISGLEDDDILENRAENVSINGGSGNNNFVNDGVSVTMISGDGADVIANAGNAALINAGNGKNSIGNAGDAVFISTGNGNDIIINEGNNVTMNVAGGSNEITNKGSQSSIIANGNNSINNYGTDVTVTGGTGNDKIMNGNSNVTLNGNKGSDVFVNYFAVEVDDNYNVTSLLYDGNNVVINGDDMTA